MNNMSKLIIIFKKLDDKAVIPSRAHEGDAGWDLTCTSFEYNKNDLITYHTGIAMAIPENHVGLLFPRSSVFKQDLILSNCVGVIDSSYRGEIMLKFRTTQPFSKRYDIGERIGQIIIMPYPSIEFSEVDTLPDSDRGEGGYGSSGK